MPWAGPCPSPDLFSLVVLLHVWRQASYVQKPLCVWFRGWHEECWHRWSLPAASLEAGPQASGEVAVSCDHAHGLLGLAGERPVLPSALQDSGHQAAWTPPPLSVAAVCVAIL